MTCSPKPFSALFRLALLSVLLGLPGSGLSAADPHPATADSWKDEVMYFLMTDRFFDGDPDNNIPEDSDAALYDPKQENINLYHGGDFRGLELAIQDGYFSDLGVTAIWITPPVENAWFSPYDKDGSKTGYHGYWTQDFLDIDPHLTSAANMEGVPYPPGREGRLQHYRDLVALANRNGIKIVQDIICNHIGPIFYYDFDGNGKHDLIENEWLPPYFENGSYIEAAVWADEPAWNMRGFGGPLGNDVVLGAELNTTGLLGDSSVYWGKGFNRDSLGKKNGEEIMCDFFALRAINTSPEAPHFDALVNEFVEIYRFYIEEIGVDGLRIDTVKHVHKEFWDAFTLKLRERLGDDADQLFIFGEVFGNSLEDINDYMLTEDGSTRCYDSLLNFQFTWAIREALRKPKHYRTAPLAHFINRMQREIEGNAVYPVDAIRKNQINFIGNHDGPNRFLVRGIEDAPHFLALAFMLTMEGIPCIYYGSELAVRDDAVDHTTNSETGRFTLFDRAGKRDFSARTNNRTFTQIEELIELRREIPALGTGAVRLIDTGADREALLAFQRGQGAETLTVVMNFSRQPKQIDLSDKIGSEHPLRLLYANGRIAEREVSPKKVEIAPLSIQLLGR